MPSLAHNSKSLKVYYRLGARIIIWIEYRRMGDGTREVVVSGALSALAEEVAQGRYG